MAAGAAATAPSVAIITSRPHEFGEDREEDGGSGGIGGDLGECRGGHSDDKHEEPRLQNVQVLHLPTDDGGQAYRAQSVRRSGFWTNLGVSCENEENNAVCCLPDLSAASAMAYPPPISKTMPQGIFSCTAAQVRSPSLDSLESARTN